MNEAARDEGSAEEAWAAGHDTRLACPSGQPCTPLASLPLTVCSSPRNLLLRCAGVEAAELKKIEKDVKKEVDTAVENAKAAPAPPDHWLYRNVYEAPANCILRTVDGEYKQPEYDPAYKS